MIRAVWVLLLWAAGAASQTVEGTIVNAVSGAGIPGAKVRLTRDGEVQYTALADGQGHFRIEGVKTGVYSTHYSAERFITRLDPASAPKVRVSGGDLPVRTEGRLIPCGRVSGRVIDGRGDPVVGARVDMNTRSAFWSARTDAEGRFSLNAVVPGAAGYTMSATPPPGWKAPDPEPDNGPRRGWIRTFYPNAALENQAVLLVVEPDGEIANLEIKLLAAPLRAIRGIVLNPDGAPAAQVALQLWDSSPVREPAYRTESKAGGGFAFENVAYGDWRLSTVPDREAIKPRAAEWVEMKGHDVDGVKLRLTMPFPVKGKVILEAPQGMQAPPAPPVLLLRRHRGQLIFSAGEAILSGDPEADGSFEIETVDAGTYQILPGPPPPLYYIDSVRLGENAGMADVELSPGAPEITVVYKTGGGTVRGSVDKCAGGQVLLLPEQRTNWPAFRGTCDGAGRFEIGAIRPGAYSALAFPDYLLVNQEVAAPFLRSATRVTVRAGEVTQVDLKLTGGR